MTEQDAREIYERIARETDCKPILVRPLPGYSEWDVHVKSPSRDRTFVFREWSQLDQYQKQKPDQGMLF